MSVHRDPKSGAWRVFYRVGDKQRTRSFARGSDAKLFDANLTRKRALGADLAAELARSELTLDGFVRAGWQMHACTLSIASRHKYAWALEPPPLRAARRAAAFDRRAANPRPPAASTRPWTLAEHRPRGARLPLGDHAGRHRARADSQQPGPRRAQGRRRA
jgi:hypothetical protein